MNTTKVEPSEAVAGPVERPVRPLPQWLRGMPAHTQLGVRELADILGIHRSNVHRGIERGTVPPPSTKVLVSGGKMALRWSLGDVRRWLRPGWHCNKCGADRAKAACPKGHSAALTGECPMVGTAA